jgi:ABC-type dipeptide/oligopeptide/nickel transport systems, permease components
MGLLILTFFVIMTVCFTLIKLLQPELPMMGEQAKAEMARREALGYNKPIIVQYGIYLRNIVTRWDWGTSWEIDYMSDVRDVIADRLPPTLILNIYSIIFSIPIGILLGIIAAIRKNKPADHIISTSIMLFVSVPSYIYAFIVQYFLGFKLNLFPVMLSSLYDAGGRWFSPAMIRSMALPVMALSFGTIADLARYVRAELTEALTSDYMLLARAKGLTKTKATIRHAMKNAMVPILPMIISLFLGILGRLR